MNSKSRPVRYYPDDSMFTKSPSNTHVTATVKGMIFGAAISLVAVATTRFWLLRAKLITASRLRKSNTKHDFVSIDLYKPSHQTNFAATENERLLAHLLHRTDVYILMLTHFVSVSPSLSTSDAEAMLVRIVDYVLKSLLHVYQAVAVNRAVVYVPNESNTWLSAYATCGTNAWPDDWMIYIGESPHYKERSKLTIVSDTYRKRLYQYSNASTSATATIPTQMRGHTRQDTYSTMGSCVCLPLMDDTYPDAICYGVLRLDSTLSNAFDGDPGGKILAHFARLLVHLLRLRHHTARR